MLASPTTASNFANILNKQTFLQTTPHPKHQLIKLYTRDRDMLRVTCYTSDVPPRSFCKGQALVVPVAVHEVVDRQPRRLHERAHDHRSHEPEPSLLQVLAYQLGLGGPKRDVPRVPVPVYDRLVVHAAPHVTAERPELPHDLQLSS